MPWHALPALAALVLGAASAVAETAPSAPGQATAHSVARIWNEVLLQAIRNDFARPTIHARNLFHFSIAAWDAWAAYDRNAVPVLFDERVKAADVPAARREAISFAAYRVLHARYRDSPGAVLTLAELQETMDELGYDPAVTTTDGRSAAAVGNRIAARVLAYGATDGSRERTSYAFDNSYRPVNPPLVVALSGVGQLTDANRWQPLALRLFVDQAGRRQPGNVQGFIGPHWGQVAPFAMATSEQAAPGLYLDPGPPPYLGGARDAEYKRAFLDVIRYGATLTPDDGVHVDISPAVRGNNRLGYNDGLGYVTNPATGRSYQPNVVKRGDYARVIAEFWADGPDSETPPGHWNTLANWVNDHPDLVRRIGGVGAVVDPLQWDVKVYLALNGALHDAAVCAWGIKGHYDYVRPITAIRYMAGLGQSSDPDGPAYHRSGLPLEPGLVEVITERSAAPGQRHQHLREHVGQIAVFGWRGAPADPATEHGAVGWILGEQWLPYQRDTFVTPPFAGYISGHSTFSRAGAEVLTRITGDRFFPGGLGTFRAERDSFLQFENGPTETVVLQWATYYDAADEAAISRLYGGIHPWVDDIPGRRIGAKIGAVAYQRALGFFADDATGS